MDRYELFNNIKLRFPKGKGVEIGVFKGEFSKHILSNWNGKFIDIHNVKKIYDDYYEKSLKVIKRYNL